MKSRLVAGAACLVLALAGGWLDAKTDDSTAKERSPEFAKAWDSYQKGKPDRDAFRKIADSETHSTRERFNAHYILGVIAIDADDPKVAVEHLAAAEKLIDDRPQVALRYAEACLKAGDPRQAAKWLKKAEKRGIKKSESLATPYHIAIARTEIAAGHEKQGFARLGQLARKDAKNWQVPMLMGQLYEQQGQVAPAIESYALTIERLPETDPCPGIYAYQRWAALSIGNDAGSYGKSELIDQALEYYAKFLKRAKANQVPEKVIKATSSGIYALEYMKKQRGGG